MTDPGPNGLPATFGVIEATLGVVVAIVSFSAARFDRVDQPTDDDVRAASVFYRGGIDVTDQPWFFDRGRRYRETLQQVDTRIAVSGIRGKSTTVRRLHDVFHERGYDTFAKITGDQPVTLHNGEERPIERRGAQTTLYENRYLITRAVERLESADPAETNVAVFENHAITEYTMRVFNETFFRPDVVVVPNVRTDHTETLGRTRQDITRSFARSIPREAHVVSGERNDAVHEYLAKELRARGVAVSRVDVPPEYRDLPGAESVFCVDHVLELLDEPPLPEDRVERALRALRPSWRRLADGSRVFNAAKVNEIESTELFRRLLAGTGDDAELVCPLVFFRGDRRGRTASFATYLDDLYDRGYADRAHLAGANARAVADRVDVPVTVHDADRESPADVLDAALAEGQPVMTMANTVHPFMRSLVAEISERTVETVAPA